MLSLSLARFTHQHTRNASTHTTLLSSHKRERKKRRGKHSVCFRHTHSHHTIHTPEYSPTAVTAKKATIVAAAAV